MAGAGRRPADRRASAPAGRSARAPRRRARAARRGRSPPPAGRRRPAPGRSRPGTRKRRRATPATSSVMSTPVSPADHRLDRSGAGKPAGAELIERPLDRRAEVGDADRGPALDRQPFDQGPVGMGGGRVHRRNRDVEGGALVLGRDTGDHRSRQRSGDQWPDQLGSSEAIFPEAIAASIALAGSTIRPRAGRRRSPRCPGVLVARRERLALPRVDRDLERRLGADQERAVDQAEHEAAARVALERVLVAA